MNKMDNNNNNNAQQQSQESDNTNNAHIAHIGVPLVFLREIDLFGKRKPQKNEWLSHVELYKAIGERINTSHIKGLQRVRGMWRIYLDNLEDKVTLSSDGVPLRGKTVKVLLTNPERLDSENTTRIRIKNIPLSVDDGTITRQLTLKGLEIIKHFREKLRVNEKLTDCETGDRLIIVKTLSLKNPLPGFMSFGNFTGRVLHFGQHKQENKLKKCNKCLQEGHIFSECQSDWVCTNCKQSGHKKADCNQHDKTDDDEKSDSSSESESESAREEEETGKGSKRANHDQQKGVSAGQPSGQEPHSEAKGTTLFFRETQTQIDKYSTPNKGRQLNVTARSPPTPPEELRDKHANENSMSKRSKKKGRKH